LIGAGEEPALCANDATKTVRERLLVNQFKSHIPSQFLSLILKCIEEDYKKRPTITEVLNELDKINNEM
jgi:hypothetical protein